VEQMDVQRNALNPYPWYREMAQRGGAQYDAVGDTWGVFRYADALSVIKDPETFSNHAPETASERLSSTVILRDPPHHRGLRQALVGWFSARASARLEARVREVAGQLVTEAAAAGDVDFIRDVAIPLPIIIMADVLGVPSADFRKFKHWCDLASSNGAPSPDGVLRFDREGFVASRERWGHAEVIDYFAHLARARRAEPAEDLLSALATIEVGGRQLTEDELAANCFQVLLAGNETTTNLLGNALLCLDDNPSVWDELRADSSLIAPMLEEVLRFRPSVHGVVRRVTRNTAVGGVEVPEGALLMVWLAAANRDPAEFAEPDRFDVRRSPNRHLAFGQGIHFCAGASLARTEARVLFEILLDAFDEIRVRPRDGGLRPVPSATLYGVTELPLFLTARR
jgi:cytochrome P450